MLGDMLASNTNCPLNSSAGRLYDAVSALLGICWETSYEGQAAIELEAAVRLSSGTVLPYPFEFRQNAAVQSWGRVDYPLREASEIILGPMLFQVVQDFANRSAGYAAYRFHLSMAAIILQTCQDIAAKTGLSTVALSGGCFQNKLLLTLTARELKQSGFLVLTHHQVPCNDGGYRWDRQLLPGLPEWRNLYVFSRAVAHYFS